MERILRGIMRYRHTTKAEMVKEFQKVRDNPEVRNNDIVKCCFIFINKFSLFLA